MSALSCVSTTTKKNRFGIFSFPHLSRKLKRGREGNVLAQFRMVSYVLKLPQGKLSFHGLKKDPQEPRPSKLTF